MRTEPILLLLLLVTSSIAQGDHKSQIASCYKSLKNQLPIFKEKKLSSLEIGSLPIADSRKVITELNNGIDFKECRIISRPKLIEFLTKYVAEDKLVDCIKPAFDYLSGIEAYSNLSAKTDTRIITHTIQLLSYMDEIEHACEAIQ